MPDDLSVELAFGAYNKSLQEDCLLHLLINVFRSAEVFSLTSSTQHPYLLIPVFVIICAIYPLIKSKLNARVNINPKKKSKFPYVSFGWITKFSIQSPTLVSVRTYKIDIKIVVKRADNKKSEIIAILFICSLSFISSNLSFTV